MAVLVRTEPDPCGWQFAWSLGEILRINRRKKTADILWLKPAKMSKDLKRCESPSQSKKLAHEILIRRVFLHLLLAIGWSPQAQ